jgi:hypothetical protein
MNLIGAFRIGSTNAAFHSQRTKQPHTCLKFGPDVSHSRQNTEKFFNPTENDK